MKIAIIGFSGSGKSTLARFLADKYKLSLLHLDSVHWLPNWQERPLDDEIAIVKSFLENHDNWVIEGNYPKVCLENRLNQADQIIMMKLPAIHCYLRVLKRYFRYRNTTRPDMGQGCHEKIDWEFTKWVLKYGREPAYQELHNAICSKYKNKVRILTTQRQIDELLVGLG